MTITDASRRRLVRLCASISGDPATAEDLAQETLLEAWRNAQKLRDPAGVDRWLAAIARNVCLRWARERGRQLPVVALDGEPSADDAQLERAELADLLDRALAVVPSDTREALVQRYVHEASAAEIGRRLGLSEAAVSMRLARGKDALRRALADDGWRETRLWCRDCGRAKLEVRFAAGAGGEVDCTRCRRAIRLRRYERDRDGRTSDGLYAQCPSCGEQVSSSVAGLVTARPEVRSLRQKHARSRSLPQRAVALAGRPAILVRHEDVLGSASVDVVFERDTLRVLVVA